MSQYHRACRREIRRQVFVLGFAHEKNKRIYGVINYESNGGPLSTWPRHPLELGLACWERGVLRLASHWRKALTIATLCLSWPSARSVASSLAGLQARRVIVPNLISPIQRKTPPPSHPRNRTKPCALRFALCSQGHCTA